MNLSILIAKILALTYISAGIAVLTGRITFRQMIEDFEKSPALTYLAGFIALTIGMLLVTHHNIWTKSWIVLITMIGWTSIVKGMILIAFPQSISYFKSWYKNSQAWGILMIIIGLLFGYFGFVI